MQITGAINDWKLITSQFCSVTLHSLIKNKKVNGCSFTFVSALISRLAFVIGLCGTISFVWITFSFLSRMVARFGQSRQTRIGGGKEEQVLIEVVLSRGRLGSDGGEDDSDGETKVVWREAALEGEPADERCVACGMSLFRRDPIPDLCRQERRTPS